jgi:trigger factor
MKTEFADVNDTRKTVRVEIPTDLVNAEIDRIARDYSRKARVPGFRPGKTPPRVIKQRFKEQILHDVAHDLIPRAVDDALREKGLEAVDTPDVREVTIEEGKPLTFTASFDTVPEFDPGDLAAIALTRASSAITEEAVQLAVQRLRDRGARHEPVEGRGVDHGDSVTLDLERWDESRLSQEGDEGA